VLSVVDELTRVAIEEGCRAAAEARARVEHCHACAAFCEKRARAQSREPASDNHDIRLKWGHSSLR
jgi:hypothetical protein